MAQDLLAPFLFTL